MTSSVKERVEKPSITEFTLGRLIGEGNFSKILTVEHKETKEQFALKVIEKQRVKRLRIRHPNVYNEINMEKEVLNRLRHPNIIRLHHTFQDEGNLYFLLEYVDGGELLNHLLHDGRQLGMNEDAARFYLADVVIALNYLRAKKVVHRDLKPENMVVDKATGHLKIVDFGTAKNMEDSTLNGPNFVGTPEYMAPEAVNNESVTYSADLWALGCILYQLLTGETPFSGGSAYLTFLKVQEGQFKVPEYVSDEAQDLIKRLLVKDPSLRLGSGSAGVEEIKAHPFFQGIDFTSHLNTKPPTNVGHDLKILDLVAGIAQSEQERQASSKLEIDECDHLQVQVRDLNDKEKSLLKHLLKRKQLLHLPGIYSRFFTPFYHARCMYARDRGYVGYTHEMQNQWGDSFCFMIISGPRLGRNASQTEQDSLGGSTWDQEAHLFKAAIDRINRAHPAFVVICGNFVNATPEQQHYEKQIAAFQEMINFLKPDIRVVLAPGPDSFGYCAPTSVSLASYCAKFGSDFYCFWYAGMKFIVLNSALLLQKEPMAEHYREQEAWLKKELENGKLCAREMCVIASHPLSENVSEPNRLLSDQIPTEVKREYFNWIVKADSRLIVCSSAHKSGIVRIPKQENCDGSDDSSGKITDLVVCDQFTDLASSKSFLVRVSQSSLTAIEEIPVFEEEKKDAPTPEESDEALADAVSQVEVA